MTKMRLCTLSTFMGRAIDGEGLLPCSHSITVDSAIFVPLPTLRPRCSPSEVVAGLTSLRAT